MVRPVTLRCSSTGYPNTGFTALSSEIKGRVIFCYYAVSVGKTGQVTYELRFRLVEVSNVIAI